MARRKIWIHPASVVGRTIALVCLLLVTSQCSRTGTRLSENFDELTPKLGVVPVGAFHAIKGTTVDVLGAGVYGALCHPPEAGNCIDLDGSFHDMQGVLQSVDSVTLKPGGKYYLSFDLIGSQRRITTSTTVTFGPYQQTFVLKSNDDTGGLVRNALVTVDTTTEAFLTFTSNTPRDMGALLDNVTIIAVEKPAWPWLLVLLLVLLLLLIFAWKFRARRAERQSR